MSVVNRALMPARDSLAEIGSMMLLTSRTVIRRSVRRTRTA